MLKWNSRSILHKKEELISFIESENNDCILISETWLTQQDRFNLSGYISFRNDRSHSMGGGVMILIKPKFKPVQFPITTNNDIIEIIAIKIEINNLFLVIGSVYIPTQNNVSTADLCHILEQPDTPFIFGGDFNAHHTSWGCIENKSRGYSLIEALDQTNNVFLNDGSITRIAAPPNRHSAVDLTICSSSLGLDADWTVLPTMGTSDHIPIKLVINIGCSSRTEMERDNILKGISWKKFEQKVLLKFRGMQKFANVEDQYNHLIKVILDAIKNSKFQERNHHIVKHWWDNECSEIVHKRNQQFIYFRRSCSREAYIAYKKIATQARNLFRRKKSTAWATYCEEVRKDNSLRKFWRMAKHFRGRPNVNSSTIQNDPNWQHEFIAKLAPAWVPVNVQLGSADENDYNNMRGTNMLTKPFAFEEITIALTKTNNTAAGCDGLKYSVIKHLLEEIMKCILSIFNTILETGVVPTQWKTCIITPIPKANSVDVNARRPIGLLVCFRKLFEKMLLLRLEWWTEQNQLLLPATIGFRRKLGTRDCLYQLTADIDLAFVKKELLIGLFVDFELAYDKVIIDIFIKKMKDCGIPTKIRMVLNSLLTERNLRMYTNNTEFIELTTSVGIAQGSCLSPWIFNMYMRDLIAAINIPKLQYADDLTIYMSGKNLADIEWNLQSTIDIINIWAFENGFTISASKSCIVPFSRAHRIQTISIMANNMQVPVRETVKYLGVWFDRKLKFTLNSNYIIEKSV